MLSYEAGPTSQRVFMSDPDIPLPAFEAVEYTRRLQSQAKEAACDTLCADTCSVCRLPRFCGDQSLASSLSEFHPQYRTTECCFREVYSLQFVSLAGPSCAAFDTTGGASSRNEVACDAQPTTATPHCRVGTTLQRGNALARLGEIPSSQACDGIQKTSGSCVSAWASSRQFRKCWKYMAKLHSRLATTAGSVEFLTLTEAGT